MRSERTQHGGNDLENQNAIDLQRSNTTGASIWSSEQMSLPQEILFVATVCLTQFCNRASPMNQLKCCNPERILSLAPSISWRVDIAVCFALKPLLGCLEHIETDCMCFRGILLRDVVPTRYSRRQPGSHKSGSPQLAGRRVQSHRGHVPDLLGTAGRRFRLQADADDWLLLVLPVVCPRRRCCLLWLYALRVCPSVSRDRQCHRDSQRVGDPRRCVSPGAPQSDGFRFVWGERAGRCNDRWHFGNRTELALVALELPCPCHCPRPADCSHLLRCPVAAPAQTVRKDLLAST